VFPFPQFENVILGFFNHSDISFFTTNLKQNWRITFKSHVFLRISVPSGPEVNNDDDESPGGGGDAGASGGPQEKKPKTPQQRAGHALVKHILEEVDGECYSFR